MRKIIIVIITTAIFVAACEADLQVYTDDYNESPVVYCLINPIDTIHIIRLAKTINASVNPNVYQENPGYMLIENPSLCVKLISNAGDTIVKYPEKVEACNKSPGFFGSSTHDLYSFEQIMTKNYISLFKKIELEIDIPRLPTVRGSSDIIVKPRIRFPYIHAEYLFVDPSRPILVQWYGAEWNEVDIQFDILEQYHDSTITQSFKFEENTNILMKEGICELKFPYELIIQNLQRTLDPRKDVIRRYFGPVFIQVHSGNKEYAYYMNTKDGINDFTGQTISNLENAIGFLGCKLSYKFKPLYFDYFTRQRFADDPDLKPFRFKEY